MVKTPAEIVVEFISQKEEEIADAIRNMIYDILDEAYDPQEFAATVLPPKEEIIDMMWRIMEDLFLPF